MKGRGALTIEHEIKINRIRSKRFPLQAQVTVELEDGQTFKLHEHQCLTVTLDLDLDPIRSKPRKP